MKKRHILFQAVSLGLALLMAGCGAASSGNSATGETSLDESSAETTAAPAYTGPLYELTLENLNERLPNLQTISQGEEGESTIEYGGLVLWRNFRENDTLEISREYQSIPGSERQAAYRKFCDMEFQMLPMEGYLKFLSGYNGYRMFVRQDQPDATESEIDIYGPDNALAFTTEGKYQYRYAGANLTPAILKTGWLPVTETATSLSGFVNIYTNEWHPLESAEYGLYGWGMDVNAFELSTNSIYSEGLAFVAVKEAARIYDPGTPAQRADNKVVGFIDESGAFAFRFDEIPDFDGLMVTGVTGYKDGGCIVACRVDDGVTVGTTHPGQIEGVDIDGFYRIDTSGNVVEEVDYDTYDAFRDEVVEALGIYDTDRGSYCTYQADSLQVAEGLELRVGNPLTEDSVKRTSDLGGYTLVDANGTVYPLDDYGVVGVLVGDDGTILLHCNADKASGATMEQSSQNPDAEIWYRLQYDWVAPEGYVLPENWARNLSAEGLPTVTEYRRQQQVIYVNVMDLTNINDLTLHFTGDGINSTYTIKEGDYISWEVPGLEASRELNAQFSTLYQGDIVITCDWTDDAGQAHHGSYQADQYSIVEDAA